MKRFFLFGIMSFAFMAVTRAQDSKVVADKIIAQIGDHIIVKSNVDGDILYWRSQSGGQALPPDMDCSLLKEQIIQQALSLQAEKVDSLTVSDDQVESAFQNRLQRYVSAYGSKEAAEKAMGMTVDQFRQDTYADIKNSLLAQQEQQEITKNVTVSPSEVQAYFNTIPKDSLAYFESQFQANQIVIYPVPNQSTVDDIKKELEEWKKEAETGKANFAELAHEYTDDGIARQNNGQMNINREDDKGHLDPEFLNAAFRLREGQISPVIKDKAGRYHIIQMVSRVGNDAIVRYIVKIPPVTDVEIKEAISRMDTVHDLLSKHQIDFDRAFVIYNEDEDAKFNAGAVVGYDGYYPVTPFAIDQLRDKDMEALLPTMKVGDYSDPQVFADQNGKQGVRIVYLRSRTDAHRENMQDDYDKIAAKALQDKQNRVVENWVTTHMQDFYIKIDPSYGHCLELTKWMNNSNERIEHFSSGAVVSK